MNGGLTSGEGRAAGPDTVLFGIGNCGRGDDGLGWAFLDRVRQSPAFGGRIEYRYQLQVEDAALACQAHHVIFVDSCQGELPGGFQWLPCEPSENFEFTTHVLPPRAVMHFCRELYGATPRADLLMISGVRWGLCNGMTEQARRNLDSAYQFFTGRFCPDP